MAVRINLNLSIMLAIFLLALQVHHAVAIFLRPLIVNPDLKVDQLSCMGYQTLIRSGLRDLALIGQAGSDAIEKLLESRPMDDDERRRIEEPLKVLFGERILPHLNQRRVDRDRRNGINGM